MEEMEFDLDGDVDIVSWYMEYVYAREYVYEDAESKRDGERKKERKNRYH